MRPFAARGTRATPRAAAGLSALLVTLAAAPLAGQEVGAGLSPDSATVGDVVRAALAVRLPPGWRVALPDTLALPPDVERAGSRSLREDSLPGGGRRLTAVYPLTAWRPGEHTLPEVEVVLLPGEGSGSPEPVRRSVRLPTMVVGSVLPADTAGVELRPLKGVLGADRVWWPWILALLLLALAVALVVWLLLRRRARAPGAPAAEVRFLSPRERALQELERVAAADWLRRGEVKTYVAEMSAVVRRYLEATGPDWTTDLTTRELELRLDGALGDEGREPLLGLLREADQVKFAGIRMPPARAEASLDVARAWIATYPPPPPPPPPPGANDDGLAAPGSLAGIDGATSAEARPDPPDASSPEGP